ncbi:GMC oxidoreductase [Paenibacillus tarimensis]
MFASIFTLGTKMHRERFAPEAFDLIVVDEWQIHGVFGLYVADNSIFPVMGAANPTLTMVALAIRTADYIIRQLKPVSVLV